MHARTTMHPDRATDFYLRALGFTRRHALTLVAHDDRSFQDTPLVGVPDWVIHDGEHNRLFVIDYKTRLAGKGPTPYEGYQVMVYGMLVSKVLRQQTGRHYPAETGILYGDGQKFDIEADANDVEYVEHSIRPAFKALQQRGRIRGGLMKVSAFAEYLADPSLSAKPDDTGRRQAAARGTAAHARLKSLSNLAPGTA